jgi:hypothetical protein
MSHEMPTLTSLSYAPAISIRRADGRDHRSIERLAALDSAPAPRQPVLLAEVDGEPWAALSLHDGHAVADPFRRSAGILELLRARAGQKQSRRAPGRPLLAPRWAA